MELHKNMTLDPTSTPASSHTMTSASMSSTLTTSPSPLAIPLSQLVKPTPLALGLSSAAAAAAAAATPTTSALFTADLNNITSQSRKNLTTKLRVTATHNGSKKAERNKFAPY